MKTAISFILSLLIILPSLAFAEQRANSKETASTRVALDSLWKLRAKEALKEAMYCWAEGHDTIAFGDKQGGIDTWERCYAADEFRFQLFVRGQFFAAANSSQERGELINDGFRARGYTGAVHVPTNFRFDFKDRDTVTVTAYLTTNHFIPNGVEIVWGVYTGEFRRVRGEWRAVDETIQGLKYVNLEGFDFL